MIISKAVEKALAKIKEYLWLNNKKTNSPA